MAKDSARADIAIPTSEKHLRRMNLLVSDTSFSFETPTLVPLQESDLVFSGHA